MFPIQKIGRALFLSCAGVVALLGCPIYETDCDEANDCASGFYCDQFSQRCAPVEAAVGCVRPSECEIGETCTPDFICEPGSCAYHGCVAGYTCAVVDSAHACVTTVDDAGPADAALEPADAGAVDASLLAP